MDACDHQIDLMPFENNFRRSGVFVTINSGRFMVDRVSDFSTPATSAGSDMQLA